MPKKRISIGNAAALLIATALVGQALGFLRTRLINTNFPTTGPDSTGIYFAAFNIPDFFFYTIAAGALGVAFIPVLTDKLQSSKKEMWEVASSLLNMLSIIMLVVGVIIFIFAEPLIKHIVTADLTPEQLSNATTLMRFLSLNPFLFTVAGVLTSAQQTMGRFFFYAIAPLFYNVSIIMSVYIFRHTDIGIVGLGIGALAGGIIQLAVVTVGLIGTRFWWRPKINWRNAGFRTVTRQLPARSLDQGMDQVQSVVETRFASEISTPTISHYNNAYTLHTAPILLLGTAISTAAFPRLNLRLSQNRPDLFRKDFLMVLRTIIWLAVPVVIIVYYARGYLARLLAGDSAPEVALVLGYLTVAIFFRIIYAIISRWFYAQKDSKTPLLVSVFTIGLNIILAAILSRSSAYGVAGLAMAQSIVAAVEVVILSAIMLKRDRGLFNGVFWGAIVRIVSVSGFSLVAGYIVVSFLPLGINEKGLVILGSKLAAIAGTIFIVHLTVSGLFGLDEAKSIFERIKRIILKPIKLQ